MKKWTPVVVLLLIVSFPVKAGANDTWIPESQIKLCEVLGGGVRNTTGTFGGFNRKRILRTNDSNQRTVLRNLPNKWFCPRIRI